MINDTRYRIIEWSKVGGIQGIKWSFYICILYLLAFSLLFVSGSSVILILPYGFVFGVLPATVIGGIVGVVAGCSSALPASYGSRSKRRTVSTIAVVSLEGIAFYLLARGWNWNWNAQEFWDYFVVLIIVLLIPVCICLVMVFWLSGKLPDLSRAPIPEPSGPLKEI